MLRDLAPSSYYGYWREIIRVYNACQLTLPSDKLDAISGVAKDLEKVLDSRYLAGIWVKHICTDLLWSNRSRDGVAYNQDFGTRNREYQAPSWSWASFNGTPRWRYHFGAHNYVAEFVHGDVKEIQAGSLGKVKSGFIHLRGLLIKLGLTIQNLINQQPPRLPSGEDVVYYNYEILLDANPKEDPRLLGIDKLSDVYILPIMVESIRKEDDSCLLGSSAIENLKSVRSSPIDHYDLKGLHALILQRTGNGEYQRLGLLSAKSDYVYALLNHMPILQKDEYMERYNDYLYSICII